MAFLPARFFQGPDVQAIARDLLGAMLYCRTEGVLTGGRIVETEAYEGVTDRASHAYGGRRTDRTEIMYGPGGRAYVYLCYGIHHLFNVVTNVQGTPHAVLIRALEPVEGIAHMQARMGKPQAITQLCAGPGKLCKALGISLDHQGKILTPTQGIWMEPALQAVAAEHLGIGTRVGVAYAGEDAFLPYRYWIKDHPSVSKAKGIR